MSPVQVDIEAAQTWIDAQLGPGQRVGPLTPVHERPWSWVGVAPTRHRRLFLKAAPPFMVPEAGIVAHLAAHMPEHTQEVVAVELDRGWLLTWDAGQTLRAAAHPGKYNLWCEMMRTYGRFQRRSSRHAVALEALGCRNGRLDRVGQLFDDLLDRPDLLKEGEDGLSRAELEALAGARGALEAVVAALANTGIEEALVHNDLHDNNIFFDGTRYIFFDWGDALISHPFVDGLLPMRVAAARFGWTTDDPRLEAMAEAYLDAWSDVAAPHTLRAALDHGHTLAALTLAATWLRIAHSGADGASERASVARWGRRLGVALGALQQRPADKS